MPGLRVIAGRAKGRKLYSVPGDTTRPITDRAKESLFNILGIDLQGSTFLDLFAGTGAVGIEALSRGAAYVLFIDINRKAVHTILANLEHTDLEEGADVRRANAFNLFHDPPPRRFDYVYIAPPQYKELWTRALIELDDHPEWMAEDAWVVAQIHPSEYEALALHHLVEFDQRRYGSTLLVFYERPIEDE
jgi:16S rRNA (guanine966-N2)-methyltransferase